jgi:hypothetical protein
MIEANFQRVECEALACDVGGRMEVDAKVGGGWVICRVDIVF